MRKITVFMLLCLMMTTPYIGGEAQQEETVREAILPASHDAVRKSVTAAQRARIIREHQSLGIERLTSHVPKGLWKKGQNKVLTGLPTSINSLAQANSPLACFVRRIFWKAGFSKTATRKIVNHFFPSNTRIKREARRQRIARGQFRYNLLVRQKALHLYLTKLVYGRHAIKGFDAHIAKLESSISNTERLLAGAGGYIPEDILRAEAEVEAEIKQLEINAKEEWINSLDFAEHNRLANRVWKFTTSIYSEEELKAIKAFDIEVVKLLDEENTMLGGFYTMMRGIISELRGAEKEVTINGNHVSALLSNIPTLKADNVKSWEGTPALDLLKTVMKGAEGKDETLKELDQQVRWKSDFLPTLEKEQQKMTNEWCKIKTAHDKSSAYLCYLRLTSAEAQLRDLCAQRREISPNFDIGWFEETRPWESSELSLSLLKDQFIDTHLTFSPEKLSILHHPIMMYGDGITAAALADAMVCEVREDDDEFITIARSENFNFAEGVMITPFAVDRLVGVHDPEYALSEMTAWSKAHGLPTKKNYRDMTLQELEEQCLASSIQLGLPNGVLKELGLYFNEIGMEGKEFRKKWTGDVYDFASPTPNEAKAHSVTQSMKDMMNQFNF